MTRLILTERLLVYVKQVMKYIKCSNVMSETTESNNFQKCGQPTMQQCMTCGLDSGCGCQRQNKYQVCQSTTTNFIKTTTNLSFGERIFSELPLIVGPSPNLPEGQIPCIGCNKYILDKNCDRCPKCFLPVCGPQCQGTKHEVECDIFKLRSNQDFRYNVLLPLRALFLQRSDVTQWEKLLKRIDSSYVVAKNSDVDYIDKNFLIPLRKEEEESNITILEHKSRDILTKISYFLESHSYETESATFFYPTASLLDHSCTPNTSLVIKNGEITIKANSDISEDTKLTCSTTNLFIGTHARLEELRKHHKSCFCDRCNDPTEFGTFFSALKCLGTKEDPCGGTQLPLKPTSDDTEWICDKCKIELPNDQVVKFVKHLGGEVDKILAKEVTVEELEEFIGKLLMFLHPNHFYVCSVKGVLVRLYTNDSMATKIQIYEDLIGVVRKLEGGGLRLGWLLHDLFLIRGDNTDNTELIAEMKKIGELYEDPDFFQAIKEDESRLASIS